jgi:hypothetical protein
VKVRAVWLAILVVIVGGVFTPHHSHAQVLGWTEFYTNSVGDKFFYDQDNVKIDEDKQLVIVVVKTVNRSSEIPIRDVSHMMEIDCGKRQYRQLASETTQADGTVRSTNRPSMVSLVQENPLAESLFGRVCKNLVYRPKTSK